MHKERRMSADDKAMRWLNHQLHRFVGKQEVHSKLKKLWSSRGILSGMLEAIRSTSVPTSTWRGRYRSSCTRCSTSGGRRGTRVYLNPSRSVRCSHLKPVSCCSSRRTSGGWNGGGEKPIGPSAGATRSGGDISAKGKGLPSDEQLCP